VVWSHPTRVQRGARLLTVRAPAGPVLVPRTISVLVPMMVVSVPPTPDPTPGIGNVARPAASQPASQPQPPAGQS
jgi:hypothetical protein